jgi:uncharacterized protein (DUF2062 family)
MVAAFLIGSPWTWHWTYWLEGQMSHVWHPVLWFILVAAIAASINANIHRS